MSPRMPSWIRSSKASSWPWYRRAIDTTKRRLELIIRCLAASSPRSIRPGEIDLLGGREKRKPPNLLEEQLQSVGRRDREVLVRIAGLAGAGLAGGGVAPGIARLDALLGELLHECCRV